MSKRTIEISDREHYLKEFEAIFADCYREKENRHHTSSPHRRAHL